MLSTREYSWSQFVDKHPGLPESCWPQLAARYAARTRHWVLDPILEHWEDRKRSPPRHSHLTTLMVLACCIESQASIWLGDDDRNGNQGKRVARLLVEFGRSEWSTRWTNEDYAPATRDRNSWYCKKQQVSTAERFAVNFRHALVHGLKVRHDGYQWNSAGFFEAQPRQLEDGTAYSSLVFNTGQLVEELRAVVDAFLTKLEEATDPG